MSCSIKYDNIIIKKRLLINRGELNLKDNGIYLIKGKNGTGKSLLLSNIFSKISEGAIFVSQNNNLILEEISIKENILLGRASKEEEVMALLEKLGLKYILNLNSKTLSGGEKRIINILRAIASDNQLIIVDEPTNDLDIKKVNMLIKILDKCSKNKIFLMATHDDRLDSIANEVLTIGDNKLNLKKSNWEMKNFPITTKYTKNNQDFTQKIRNKVLKFPILIEIAIFILLATFTFNRVSSFKKITEPLEQILHNTNQVNLFYYGSRQDINVKEDRMLKFKDYCDGNFKDAVPTQLKVTPIENVLKLEDTKYYKVYPLEFYDENKKDFISTVEVCVYDILKLTEDIQNQYIDSDLSSFLECNLDDYKDYELLKIDEETFNKAVKYIKQNYPKAIPTYVSIVFNKGLGIKDFVNDKQIKDMKKDNVYIWSVDTENIVRASLEFITNRVIISDYLKDCGTVLLIYAFSLFIMFEQKRKKIAVFRNYNIHKDSIKKSLQKNTLILTIAKILILCLYYMYIYSNSDYRQKYAILFIISCGIIVIVLNGIMKTMLTNKGVNQLYSWKSRV